MRGPGSSSRAGALLLAVTGIGHGQKGTARALLEEFARRKDSRASLLDFDGILTGTALFRAARAESALEGKALEFLWEASDPIPDALAAFDPVAARLCAQMFPSRPLALVQCGLVSDPRWPWDRAHLVLVPDEAAAEVFFEKGVAPDRIVPVGLPLCPGFMEGASLHREEAVLELGLDPQRPVLLLSVEGLSAFDAKRAAFQLASPPGLLQVAVDLGADLEAAEVFDDLPELVAGEILVFGKTDLASRWWAAADLVVCHPSDHVVARALALGKPLVLVPPDRPSARRVVRSVLDRHLGFAAGTWQDLRAEVARALSVQPRLQRAASLYRGGAAVRRIATALQAFLGERTSTARRFRAVSESVKDERFQG